MKIFCVDPDTSIWPVPLLRTAPVWGDADPKKMIEQARRCADILGGMKPEDRCVFLQLPFGQDEVLDSPPKLIEAGAWSAVPVMARAWAAFWKELKRRINGGVALVACDYEHNPLAYYACWEFFPVIKASPALMKCLPPQVVHAWGHGTGYDHYNAWQDYAATVRAGSLRIAIGSPYPIGNYTDSMGYWVDGYGRKSPQAAIGKLDMPDLYMRFFGDPNAPHASPAAQGVMLNWTLAASVEIKGREAVPWIAYRSFDEWTPGMDADERVSIWTKMTQATIGMFQRMVYWSGKTLKAAEDHEALAAIARRMA